MTTELTRALIETIPERCRVCYTCVRECPAKAIRIAQGQAEVMPERCIRCGNCVRVCSQNAKRVVDDVDDVAALLAASETGGPPVAALVAPSFPAEFEEVSHERLVGALRAVGFDLVVEVGFGADLVARRHREVLAAAPEGRFVEGSCPAVVAFVELYHPEAVPLLSPVVSPMIAAARAVRALHGDALRTVFVGPCIAKKGEAAELVAAHGVGAGRAAAEDAPADRGPEIDAALTFRELRRLFARHGITSENAPESDFDPPWSGLGALFPLSRGMLQAADLDEDLVAGDVVSADGRTEFVEAIRELETGALEARLLEVLCCNGCIMGAGMTTTAPMFGRRSRISRYVRAARARGGDGLTDEQRATLAGLDLTRPFRMRDGRIPAPDDAEIRAVLARMGKRSADDELDCGACGYETCREHAVAILKGLAESEMCLPYTIERLKRTVAELGASHEELERTQDALMHSERLASMGQLAAGIAHEVNNPLGVVLMYAHMLAEEADEGSELRGDLRMIVENADRCKKIVAGLLDFARQNKVTLQGVNLRALLDEARRALTIPAGVAVHVACDDPDLEADIDRDQVVQVLVNLCRNAIDAMPEGGTLTLRAEAAGEDVRLVVGDTGTGIPDDVKGRVFEPFFTTKGVGAGTGLGLSVTYGIVKMHRGDIRLETNADPAAGPTGTTFTVTLPRQRRNGAAGA